MKHRKRRKQESQFHWVKYVIFMGSFAVFLVAMAVYCLPFVSYYQVTSAVMEKDASRLASHADLEEMRKNLKKQKGQRVIKQLKANNPGDTTLVDLSIVWSALSSDHDIDRAISTEGFYVAFGIQSGRGIKQAAEVSTYSIVRKLVEDSSFQYKSSSTFIVNVKDEQGRYVEYFSFIFTRDGLNWRLSNVILPVF